VISKYLRSEPSELKQPLYSLFAHLLAHFDKNGTPFFSDAKIPSLSTQTHSFFPTSSRVQNTTPHHHNIMASTTDNMALAADDTMISTDESILEAIRSQIICTLSYHTVTEDPRLTISQLTCASSSLIFKTPSSPPTFFLQVVAGKQLFGVTRTTSFSLPSTTLTLWLMLCAFCCA
jgi:hypothetical protein